MLEERASTSTEKNSKHHIFNFFHNFEELMQQAIVCANLARKQSYSSAHQPAAIRSKHLPPWPYDVTTAQLMYVQCVQYILVKYVYLYIISNFTILSI